MNQYTIIAWREYVATFMQSLSNMASSRQFSVLSDNSLIARGVNPAIVSTLRFYDIDGLHRLLKTVISVSITCLSSLQIQKSWRYLAAILDLC